MPCPFFVKRKSFGLKMVEAAGQCKELLLQVSFRLT